MTGQASPVDGGRVMWAITGKYGLYYGSNFPTRREAIDDHCGCVGVTWAQCRRDGDRAIKVRITPIPNRRATLTGDTEA